MLRGRFRDIDLAGWASFDGNGTLVSDDVAEAFPTSLLYAYAALDAGRPYVNFTPSLGSSVPALDELARARGTVHAGRDGKTGETLVKTTLAPLFALRNLRVLAWEGYNMLGNPDGEALNTRTGFKRNYRRLPYQGYEDTPRTMFPVQRHRDDLETKTWVAGVIVDGTAKAYPIQSVPADRWVKDQVDETAVRFRYQPESALFELEGEAGESLPVVKAYWFAWQAFYPDTKLYSR